MSSAPHEVSLVVDGREYPGWKGGDVSQGMEQLASTFSLRYFDAWSEDGSQWPIREGARCEVRIDGDELIAGYVDDAESAYREDSWELSVSGRSVLADLVDCAALHDSTQWLDRGLDAIVGDLIEPFGLAKRIDDPGDKFRRFKFEPGERTAEVIARAAKRRGLHAIDDVGTLHLTRAGSGGIVDTLRRGDNVLEGRRRGSWRDRFSKYIALGQTQGNPNLSGKSASQIEGTVEDAQVDRYRPTVLMSASQDGQKDLETRATIERNQRAGRSERLTYKVRGFRHRGGGIWRPNQLVDVEDDWLRVQATLIVAAVRMSFGPEEEMATRLELTHPEAFALDTYPEAPWAN